jgi:DMSO reductase anchor subunit
MHPAPSVILFTALSGIGFGLLTFLCLGLPALTGWTAALSYGAGVALAVAGLVSSTFHLGHPERAILAFSQWRSSWLSREAWAAVLALLLVGLHAIGPVFLGQRFAIAGLAAAALCLATVFATASIYTQIRAVPRWSQPMTPVLFLAISLAGGALLAGQALAAVLALIAAAAAQARVWHVGDGAFARAGTTLVSATGLSDGAVRAFEPPHTGRNYLLDEMVHVVGRRHAAKLRRIGFTAAFVVPLAVTLLTGGAIWAMWAAAAVHLGGVLALRWLFFAEAEHVVGLYYGRRAA